MTAAWRAGFASDPGRQRTINEDRVLADENRGIFLVVDGLGGHAAGETAAETALETIRARLQLLAPDGDAETAVREAITEANNQIYALAQGNPAWAGMACVLTLAVAQDERITVGHVGDSRLYLIWNGQLRKLTSDHSPVGEREDAGELTEDEAMQHPRRNEVFRDVGSRMHALDDDQFIDVKTFAFRHDAALLLCTDGLTDVLTSAEIARIVESYDGDPTETAQRLVTAANEAGGKDNISVVFVPGAEFLGNESHGLADARSRHAVTRMRTGAKRWPATVRDIVWLIAGIVLGICLGIALGTALDRLFTRGTPQTQQAHGHQPIHISVDPADAHGIEKALELAVSGDTIDIPAAEYLGPIELKDGVNLIGTAPGQAILRSDPAASKDAGVAIVARSVHDACVTGIHIEGDETHPLQRGLWIANSTIRIENLDISGAIDAGIRIDGTSQPVLLANFVHANPGTGLAIRDHSTPLLTGNWISENGTVPGSLRSGIEIDSDGRARIERNVIVHNGIEQVQGVNPNFEKRIESENVTDRIMTGRGHS